MPKKASKKIVMERSSMDVEKRSHGLLGTASLHHQPEGMREMQDELYKGLQSTRHNSQAQ